MYFFIASNAYTEENTNKIDSIVIKQAPWHIETPVAVTCHNFENDVSFMEYHVTDSTIISALIRELSCLKKSNTKSLDVRCKIYFYSSGDICKSACIDPADVLYDSELYKLSPTLKNTIDSITNISKRGKLITTTKMDNRDIPFPNGSDSLYQCLLSQSEELYEYIDKPIVLVVICQIDSQGNTMNTKIKDKDNNPINNKTKELFDKISDIFVNKIKWIPNKERYPYETVMIPISFVLNSGDSK